MYTNYLPLSIFGTGIFTVIIIALGCVCKSKKCNIPCPRIFRHRFPIRTSTSSNLQMRRNFLINRTLAGNPAVGRGQNTTHQGFLCHPVMLEPGFLYCLPGRPSRGEWPSQSWSIGVGSERRQESGHVCLSWSSLVPTDESATKQSYWNSATGLMNTRLHKQHSPSQLPVALTPPDPIS